MNIDDILATHRAWLRGEGGKRADLRGTDLSGEYLFSVDFRRANLKNARLNGCRLSFSDLSRANLHKAHLQRADLTRANFAGSNLSDADLSFAAIVGADLTGANLSNATLVGANMAGATGIIHPPVNDPRGYRCVAVLHGNHWMIAAGCHWFSVEEAREHWGDAYSGNREIADEYLRAVEWVANQQAPQEPQT